MKIKDNFTKEQRELLKQVDIDIEKDFDESSLEELEDEIYNKMMDRLDKKQDFTEIAVKLEKILDIVVDIENNL